ncbi:MAG: FAD binding domain-containing protein, partial [Cyclobacteriaceae bacterium]|nr:FAD binding domain-containing protein [Cyclobacteriaceae bacterium]
RKPIWNSKLCQDKYPILVDASKLIADPSVRNRATVGGNIAHGDAANDQPAVMLAMRATIVADGPNGRKSIPIDEFFHGFYMTALEQFDILTEVHFPAHKKGTGNAYHKIERKVGDYAASGVAVNLVIDANEVVQEIGIGLTNVNSVPMRVERAEALLKGQKITDDLINQAGQMAAEDCSPNSDLRGSEAYKRSITRELTKRMITKALERAKA